MTLDVYGFKAAIEPAIAKALTDKALAVFCSQDPQQFQKDRARVEVVFTLGAGVGHYAKSEETGQLCDVEDAWHSSTTTSVITAAEPKIHSAYEAEVRHVMHQLPPLINGATEGLQNHVIYGPIVHVGSSPTYKPQDGYYQTDIQWSFDISIHRNAWPHLDATDPFVRWTMFGGQWRQDRSNGTVYVLRNDGLWYSVTEIEGGFIIDRQGGA